jgi:glycogen operon protein
MERVDAYPTHDYQGYKLRHGKPFPFGTTFVPGGVNFSIYSDNATNCTLVLFSKGEEQPMVEIPFPEEFRIGDVFAMIVFGLDYENIEYGYRMDGPFEPQHGHRLTRQDTSGSICQSNQRAGCLGSAAQLGQYLSSSLIIGFR